MTAAVPDPRFRDQLAQLLLNTSLRSANQPNSGAMALEQAAALMPVIAAELARVQAAANQRAAEEIERLADERTWVTEHDNEVVSTRELYEHVARLRGELEPVTYDFPPDTQPEANDGPGSDGHHVVTGECFACMVGVATGPESHGDRCPAALASPAPEATWDHRPLGGGLCVCGQPVHTASPAPAPRAEESA